MGYLGGMREKLSPIKIKKLKWVREVAEMRLKGMTEQAIGDELGISRQRVSQVIHTQAHSARQLVRYMVKTGKLPHPATLVCVDCGSPAQGYEHRDYRKPKKVVPICLKCNGRRGMGIGGRGPLVKISPKWVALLPEGVTEEDLAMSLDVNLIYLKQILGGRIRPGATLAKRIVELCPKMSLSFFRPDLWPKPKGKP